MVKMSVYDGENKSRDKQVQIIKSTHHVIIFMSLPLVMLFIPRWPVISLGNYLEYVCRFQS